MDFSKIGQMYIGGKWVSSNNTRDVINPSNGKVIAKVYEGNADDVKLAVKAAQDAFKDWGGGKFRNLQSGLAF